MKQLDIALLTDWLGPIGAVSGLEKSHLTNAELMAMARNLGLPTDAKPGRKQLSVELVMHSMRRIDRPDDFLLAMSPTELKRYISEKLVSNTEILEVLARLGIAPNRKVRGRLVDFAAREIGDLGMYQRVARGDGKPDA